MAKKEKEVTKVGEGVQEIEKTEIKLPKGAFVDQLVTVVSLPGDPYHKDGVEFDVAKNTAEILEQRGWVKIK